MSDNSFIGRRDAIGVGIEATSGTSVAPQAWQKHLSLALDAKTTIAQNNSGMGRVEDINDSALTETWAEGSINGKVTDVTIGYFLLNIFGAVSAAASGEETEVYDNTFTVLQTNRPPSLTFGRANPVAIKRYALGTQSDFELDVKTGDWAQFTSSIMTKAGSTAADSAAYTAENEFTSKHAIVKVAADLDGLDAANALLLKSLKLKISRKADRFTPFGSTAPTVFDLGSWGVTGELVLRYNDTTLEALGLANTAQAMSVALVNSDVTIGDASHPGLVFTMPQVRLSPVTLDNNLDQVLNQTINFTAEFNADESYMMNAVLTNLQNGYAAV